MDAIVHVLRCFEDPNVVHVEGGVDPIRDAETVETELMLADLEGLERRQQGLVKRARGNDKEAAAQLALIEPIVAALQAGRPARAAVPPGGEEAAKRLQLLTTKPVLYVANVEEGAAATGNEHSARVFARAEAEGARAVVVSAAIEAEISQMPEEDRGDFLLSLGLEDSGLDRIIRAGYGLLGLVTYFTVGPKEARAWTIVKGMKAPQAAGVIHDLVRETLLDLARSGRWILAAATLVGWAVGATTKLSELGVSAVTAFIAGAIILNVLKEELPSERNSRFGAFLLGSLGYSGLLLLL